MVCGLKQCYFDVSPTPFITLTRCRAGALHYTSLGLHSSPCMRNTDRQSPAGLTQRALMRMIRGCFQE